MGHTLLFLEKYFCSHTPINHTSCILYLSLQNIFPHTPISTTLLAYSTFPCQIFFLTHPYHSHFLHTLPFLAEYFSSHTRINHNSCILYLSLPNIFPHIPISTTLP